MAYGSHPYGSLGAGAFGSTQTGTYEIPALFAYINGVERTNKIIRNTVTIHEEGQMRNKKLTARIMDNFPNELEEVRFFSGYKVTDSDVNSVTINTKCNFNEILRVGDVFYVNIGESTEEYGIISGVANNSSGFYVITVLENWAIQPSVNSQCGKLKFAGNVLNIQDYNIVTIYNQECQFTAVDYTHVFNKNSVNNTYENVDGRYIINDFCNDTVNYTQAVDTMEYANDSAAQAIYTESNDGDSVEIDTTNFREGSTSVKFPWTNSGGTATFTGALGEQYNVSDWSGSSSGAPTKGVFGFWYKCSDYTVTTSFEVRVGSSSSDYISFTVTPTSNDWVFFDEKLANGTITGNPDWTLIDYVQIIVTETGSANILLDGLRFLEIEFFRHYPYVLETNDFVTYPISFTKPIEVMQVIADELQWFWWIDYQRYIHLIPSQEVYAPYTVTSSSENFNDLRFSHDSARIINTQVVEGGFETSDSFYYEVKPCDGVVKEWVMKNQFKNMEAYINDGGTTDTMEAGTTTTQVAATGHGLSEGDYIINTSRSNAVRQVTNVVDPDTFDINEVVTGQTTGDTFSLFATQADVGVEGLHAEASYDFMTNFNQKSIRNSTAVDPYPNGYYILFKYNEVVPVYVYRDNQTSIDALKNLLGYGTGVKDGDVIQDNRITSRAEAAAIADAKISKHANTIITATFETHVHGLEIGQTITITDTNNNRNIDQEFIILGLFWKLRESGYWTCRVTCSSMLFGMLEILQQLLRANRRLRINEEAVVNKYADYDETLTISDAVTAEVSPNKKSETLTISDSVTADIITPPFQYGPGGSPQGRWNLAQWG